MQFKWYYVAIPLGIFLLYELLSPRATLLKPAKSPSSGAGGILDGIGNAATGLGNLWKGIAGTRADSVSTDATGD